MFGRKTSSKVVARKTFDIYLSDGTVISTIYQLPTLEANSFINIIDEDNAVYKINTNHIVYVSETEEEE